MLASYKVACKIAKCKQPHTIAKRLIPSMLYIALDAEFSALALMKSKYRLKIKVVKESSSFISQFEKMCGDQQAHPQIIVGLG